MKIKTIHKVREAIAELNARGTKTNTGSVSNHLGISRQRVHQILKEFNELSSLDNFQQRDELERISNELKNFDTKGLLPSEIKKLPIDGIANLNVSQMSKLLCKYKIPHANNIIDKIKLINNTEQYTAQELHKIVGGNFRRLREVLYAEKIPFKNGKRNKYTVAAILQRLSEIDTSKYTSQELYELLKMDGSFAAFRVLLGSHKIKYAKRRNKDTVATILQRLSEIDTTKYSISSLARMIETTRQTLSKIVAKHNIPVLRYHRSKDEMNPIWEKLQSVDTTQYTANELIALLDNKVRHNVMLKYLAKNGMKHKRSKRKSILSKLVAIDTSQHTSRELHMMVGGDLNNLSNQLAKNKIPYRKAKTGPKKGRLSKQISKLVAIDTSQHTVKELHKMVGGDLMNLYNQLAKNKIPYKRVKPGPKK
ncbi:hypothetical protein [Burkholderia multivorans]|uniref:hypothetical protein n=1 Tax=Burkholderia multivorans TaxID=87883 RepID=UPI0011B1E627|nr:hypothetical protein [Burkholderia multivorans]